MRNLGSKLFVLLVAALIVAGLGYAFLPEPTEVDLIGVKRGMLRVTVDEDGKTRIREKYVVSAPLNGRILRISMDPGDQVEAGKTLLTMIEPRDPELLDARTVAQAEARVKAAGAALKQTEPMLEEARAAQAFAEAEVTRLREAYRRNAVSRSELDNAEFIYRQRSEQLRSARIAQEIAQFELQQARAALLRSRPRSDVSGDGDAAPVNTTNSNGADATTINHANGNGSWNFPIYSPINGRVLRVFQESAAVVMPGTPLVELGDPTDLEVEIDVLSRDAVEINPGDLVLLEHWGGKRPLEGQVRIIEPSGFTKISTLGVEEQRVNVIVDLVEPPEERRSLGDGFRVEARVVIDEARDVLKAPTSALFRVAGESAVFRVVDGVVHEQRVKVGRQNDLEAEILEGLAEGDQLVLHPSDRIEDGVRVRPR
ncbi:MAG: HlyD family efflux transporter periplasmic adaptor subunit [Pirellulales bacterium]